MHCLHIRSVDIIYTITSLNAESNYSTGIKVMSFENKTKKYK